MEKSFMEKVAENLSERLGEITKSYEIQIASLRVSATDQIEELQRNLKAAREENDNLRTTIDTLNKRLEENEVLEKDEGADYVDAPDSDYTD